MVEQVERPPSDAAGQNSYFDGNTLQLIGYNLLTSLLCVVTLGIAFPWTLCILQRWKAKHTVIHGRRLTFDGRGIQLFGKYLLWVLLTIVTLGIYGIWLGLGVKKWTVQHTAYADGGQAQDSYFSGGPGGYLGIHILAFLLTVVTLGIGASWAKTMLLRWEAGHTHIGGDSLFFDGTGLQLLGKHLLLVLLTPLTLGIYTLFFPVSYTKWLIKHTDAVSLPEASDAGAAGSVLPAKSSRSSGESIALPIILCVFGVAALFFLGSALFPLVRWHISPHARARLFRPTISHASAYPENSPSPSNSSYGSDYTQSILGTWESRYLEEHEDGDPELRCSYWSFYSDGTYYSGGVISVPTESLGLSESEGEFYDGRYWFPVGSGESGGTFRLEGDKLITVEDSFDFDDTPPVEYTVRINIEGDTLTIYDGQNGYQSQFQREDPHEVPPAEPEPEPSYEVDYTQAIVGKWCCYDLKPDDEGFVSGESVNLRSTGWVFFPDGEFYDYGTMNHYFLIENLPSDSLWENAADDMTGAGPDAWGTYYLEGDRLILTNFEVPLGRDVPNLGEYTLKIWIEGDTLRIFDEEGTYPLELNPEYKNVDALAGKEDEAPYS